MPLYNYKALDANHCIIESNIKCGSYNEAKQAIIDKGFMPISIDENKGINNISFDTSSRIRIQDVIVFCRELSIIIKSGINIVVGLDILKKQSDKKIQEQIRFIGAEIQKGRTLSQAMKELDVKFPDLLVRMISAGEKSGNIDSVLDNMADYYERENYIRQKVKSATIYPVILLLVAAVLITFFAKFILPSMEELLSGQDLPLITQIIIGGTNLLVSKYTLILIFIMVIGIVLIKNTIPKRVISIYIDNIMLRLPVIGSTMKDVITVRFTRTLYLLFKSGIDIVNILEILRDVISNTVAENVMDYSLEGIKRGEKLGDLLASTKFFDPLVVQMINVGEETGEFEHILEEISAFYERRLETKIEKLISLIEPVFTLVIGGVVALIVVSIALPMFSMVGGLDAGGLGIE